GGAAALGQGLVRLRRQARLDGGDAAGQDRSAAGGFDRHRGGSQGGREGRRDPAARRHPPRQGPGGRRRGRRPACRRRSGSQIMNLSEPFIRRPVMTAVLTVSVILFGALAYKRLPVNDLPVVDYPVIQVFASYPGASPETVANNIATPLERSFMQINGLELVTSQSTQGFVTLTLQFALSKNIDGAATDVQTAISQTTGSLPVDMPSPPSFSKNNPNDQPIMYIALTSDSVTQGQIYEYATTQVGQRIS